MAENHFRMLPWRMRGSSSQPRGHLSRKISADRQVIAFAGSEFPTGALLGGTTASLGLPKIRQDAHRTSERPCDAGKLLCNQYPAAVALHETCMKFQVLAARHGAESTV